MGIEVDFLAVGEGERSGDAIALRFGNLGGRREEQNVMIIDGGTVESGERLADHVRRYYNTDVVDYALLTHPDSDHASGFREAVERLHVRQIVMHKPWEHGDAIRRLFKNGRVSATGLERRFREALEASWDVAVLAEKRGIPIVEPFAGVQTSDGSLHVLGPSEVYYRSLLPDFRCTPAPLIGGTPLFRQSVQAFGGIPRLVRESLTAESLTDDGETSAENNSSVVLLLQYDGRKILFSGDAGIPALQAAQAYAVSTGLSLNDLTLFQVPHHGSRRNLGPSILKKISAQTAVVSAGVAAGAKHPSKQVVNALLRRGTQVYATQGVNLVYRYAAPERHGYHDVAPVPFSEYVEVETHR